MKTLCSLTNNYANCLKGEGFHCLQKVFLSIHTSLILVNSPLRLPRQVPSSSLYRWNKKRAQRGHVTHLWPHSKRQSGHKARSLGCNSQILQSTLGGSQHVLMVHGQQLVVMGKWKTSDHQDFKGQTVHLSASLNPGPLKVNNLQGREHRYQGGKEGMGWIGRLELTYINYWYCVKIDN